MYECECWTIKKAEHQTTDAFELLKKILEDPLDCEEIKPLQPKGNQSWIFIRQTDAEAETPILWQCKELTPWKRSWCWESKGRKRRGWQRVRWLKGITDSMDIEFEQALGDGERQRSLACCSLWGCKKTNRAERLNNNILSDSLFTPLASKLY